MRLESGVVDVGGGAGADKVDGQDSVVADDVGGRAGVGVAGDGVAGVVEEVPGGAIGRIRDLQPVAGDGGAAVVGRGGPEEVDPSLPVGRCREAGRGAGHGGGCRHRHRHRVGLRGVSVLGRHLHLGDVVAGFQIHLETVRTRVGVRERGAVAVQVLDRGVRIAQSWHHRDLIGGVRRRRRVREQIGGEALVQRDPGAVIVRQRQIAQGRVGAGGGAVVAGALDRDHQRPVASPPGDVRVCEMPGVKDAPTACLARVLSAGVGRLEPKGTGRCLNYDEVIGPRVKPRGRRRGERIDLRRIRNRIRVGQHVQAAARIARCVRSGDADPCFIRTFETGAEKDLDRRQRVPARVVARGETLCSHPAAARGEIVEEHLPGVRDQGLYCLRLGLRGQDQERGDGHEDPRRVAGHRTCARQRRRQAGRTMVGSGRGSVRRGPGGFRGPAGAWRGLVIH